MHLKCIGIHKNEQVSECETYFLHYLYYTHKKALYTRTLRKTQSMHLHFHVINSPYYTGTCYEICRKNISNKSCRGKRPT